MSGKRSPPRTAAAIEIYRGPDRRTRIRVRFEDDTVWLTQRDLAELYQTTVPNISTHVRNILEDGELSAAATVKECLIVQPEGGREVGRPTKQYNLDMILAVGYRVRSPLGALFRQWATERLREYIRKGFVLDDERLKGRDDVGDYFDELLARIREIRASEKRVYQRVREILAMAVDYVEGDEACQRFFATMQNKMHFAAAGMTAAEIIRSRADAAMPNMGLTTWAGERVLKRDVAVGKNYLSESEIDTLNRIVVMFLDLAEFRSQRRQHIRTRDWELFLDKFLRDTELPVLSSAGSVAHDEATAWAFAQYDAFEQRRRDTAEAAAEAGYLDDLRRTAKLLESKPAAARLIDRPSTRKRRKGRQQ